MIFAGHDFADEDLVVAAGKDLDDPTIDERQAARQDRCRRAGRGGVQTSEVLRPRVANRREISSWSTCRMLIAKHPFFVR